MHVAVQIGSACREEPGDEVKFDTIAMPVAVSCIFGALSLYL